MIEIVASINSLDSVIGEIDILNSRGVTHFVLQGDLASGKTTLVQAFVKVHGIDDLVTSPTFSIHHCYSDEIHHYDLYNRDFEELLSLGILELFGEHGVHFIEWGDERLLELLSRLGFGVGVVRIFTCDGGRRYEISEVKSA